jgi:L-aspartate oxidase
LADSVTARSVKSGELTARYLCDFEAEALSSRAVDVLIIGSGIAGLTAALLAPKGKSVLVVTKSELTDTGTQFAQGGIAGALGDEDSTGLHFEDTLRAGDGLCDRAAVGVLVTEAKDAVEWLISLGADFDRLGGNIAFALEGGHSLPRVIHAGDTTGQEIIQTLARTARATDGLEVLERQFLVDLLTYDGRCVGALFADMNKRRLSVVWSGATVLATGGAGRLFSATTNPPIATGDGFAVAYRAGAQLRDLEFIQFHPTALDTGDSPRFLISEALRGEGAVLLDCKNRRFMEGYHPLADLAPRDVVVRAMVEAMRACGEHRVWLDARPIGAKKLKSRFPAIYARCKEGGFDLAKDLVPVMPAAHYMVGGIRVDIDGQTTLPGLFASGECASTGVHGANRLASNSLLEGLVFSRRIAKRLEATERPRACPITNEAEENERTITVAEVEAVMDAEAGVVRDGEGLARAITDMRGHGGVSLSCRGPVSAMEGYNLLTLAELLACSALTREESRGAHYRSDFPDRDDPNWTRRIVHQRGRAPWLENL